MYMGTAAPPSAAGPAAADEPINLPPMVPVGRRLSVLQFSQRQIEFVFRARRELGEVFRFRGLIPGDPVVTSHPDHVRSLFTAKPELAPSITAESPLRPIVGPNSVLTANGPRHLRQRKLLLPPFHGEAIERYAAMIREVADRSIDGWPVGEPFPLGHRMQAITLDVIMSGIFGVEGRPPRGTPEHRMRLTVKHLANASTSWWAKIGELMNVGHAEPVGPMRQALGLLDGATYPIIEARRRADDLDERADILSMLMTAQTEDGELLSDQELRDELLTLVLAGFETTANSLAWTWSGCCAPRRPTSGYGQRSAMATAPTTSRRRSPRGCDRGP